MNEITLTINDKQVKGKEGDTVLDICEANSISVPTLCHFKGLTDVGACRLCVVEIEKERRPVPACTYPARDGLVVQTHTEKLEKYRRLILELLFTERNHLCAYCVASGDCELQNLAYQYQMDNTRYPYSWPSLSVDSVNDYLVIDHNRCILCGRCIRLCDEITGVHALDFGHRGWKSLVCADLNQPLGESSCISCGACAQVCPTGAIYAKSSAYRGKPDECTKVHSVCSLCGVGCEIDALVKDNRLVRIDSPELADDRGLLCHKGRFDQLYDRHDRITTALVRNDHGQLEASSLDEALNKVSEKFSKLKTRCGNDSIAGLASSQTCNETLKAFRQFINYTIGSHLVDTLDGDDYRVITEGIANFQGGAELSIETSLQEILKADCLLLAGCNPLETHPVIGSHILRAVTKNGANLILVDPTRNAFSFRTSIWLKPTEGKEELTINALTKAIIDEGFAKGSTEMKKIASSVKDVNVTRASEEAGINADDLHRAAEMLARSQHSIIIYGEGILRYRNPELITSLLNLAAISGSEDGGKPIIISLKPKGNSRGAWDIGMADLQNPVFTSIGKDGVKAVYLLLADDYVDEPRLLDYLRGIEFVVVQASYSSPITSTANVVLPSPTWAEREGSYTTLDGTVKSASRLLQPPSGVKQDWEIIQEISNRLRYK